MWFVLLEPFQRVGVLQRRMLMIGRRSVNSLNVNLGLVGEKEWNFGVTTVIGRKISNIVWVNLAIRFGPFPKDEISVFGRETYGK